MSSESDRQFIATLLHTKELHIVKSAGVGPEWLSDIGSQQALAVILEYAAQIPSLGQVPPPLYLQARMVPLPPPYHDGMGTMQGQLDVLRTGRLKTRLAMLQSETTALLAGDPVQAYAKLLQGLMAQDIVNLMSKGRADTQTEVGSRLFDVFGATQHTDGLVGLPTPFECLNYSLKGWQKGDMYCLFAPPKSMKSWIALLFALRVVAAGRRVLYVTSEMPAEQCGLRFAAMATGLNINAWRDRKLSLAEAEVILGSDPHNLMHYFQPTGLQERAIGEVYAEVQRLNWDGNLGLVIWDGHYRSAKSSEWNDMYDFVRMTRALPLDKALGRVPFLVVTQEGSKRGESGYKVYEQEASLMLYLRREAVDRIHAFTQAIRDGLTLEFKIHVDFHTGAPKFVEQQVKFIDGGQQQPQGFQ